VFPEDEQNDYYEQKFVHMYYVHICVKYVTEIEAERTKAIRKRDKRLLCAYLVSSYLVTACCSEFQSLEEH